MKRSVMVVGLFLFGIATAWADEPSSLWDGKDIRCKKKGDVCVNNLAAPIFRFGSLSPLYKTKRTTVLYEAASTNCKSPKIESSVKVPVGSYLREVDNDRVADDDYLLVDLYQFMLEDDITAQAAGDMYFDKSFKICLTDELRGRNRSVVRVGGFNTGVLVVPFKMRTGDLYSDSTIGGYLAWQYKRLQVLGSAGLTNVSVSEVGTNKVESKIGGTYALGMMFRVKRDWDVGVVVGRDHLSGEYGSGWAYQDKTWWAFAIGYNFARDDLQK